MLPERIKHKIKALLRKSEKYTKTDMVYLAKGGFWQIVERVAVISIGLVSTWAFANFLPKNTYGEYKYILSLASLLTTFSLTGISTAVAKYVAQKFEGTYRKAFGVSYKYSIFLMGISVIGAIYYWVHGNIPLAVGLILIALFQPLFNTASLYLNYLIAKKQFSKKAHYGTIYQIGLNAGLILTILLTKSVIILLIVFFALSTLISLGLYFKIYKKIPSDAPVDKGFLKYAKHLSLINILGNIASQIDSLLLFQFTGSSALAGYNVAMVIPEQIKSTNKNLASLAFAKFAENDEKSTLKGLYRKGFILVGILTVITIIYIAFAPFLFRLLFPQYMNAVFATQVFALTIPFSPRLIIQAFFEANGRVKEQYIVSIFSGVARITSLVTLIPLFGLMGAIYARVISRIATTIFSLILSIRIKREILD